MPWRAAIRSEAVADRIGRLGIHGSMCVPLVAQGTVVGAMALVAASPERQFGETELEEATELGRRAGLIVENARLYGREHRVAESLQNSLLPTLPALKSFDVSARYLTADRHAEVGGDFYEVMPLPDGTVLVTVGDVVGHDLAAAAAMGHLRGLIRTVAWTGAEDGRTDPAEVVDRINRLVRHLDAGPYATLFYGRLEPPGPGRDGWQIRYTSAGHLPPLLRHPDGTVEPLDRVRGLILGAGADAPRATATTPMSEGAVLLGFTDGLIERRNEDILVRYRRLADRLGQPFASLDGLLDDIVRHSGPDRRDDTAVLAVRLRPIETGPIETGPIEEGPTD
jgi:serine phosphatase RsbU (regulator of sigma subunit)